MASSPKDASDLFEEYVEDALERKSQDFSRQTSRFSTDSEIEEQEFHYSAEVLDTIHDITGNVDVEKSNSKDIEDGLARLMKKTSGDGKGDFHTSGLATSKKRAKSLAAEKMLDLLVEKKIPNYEDLIGRIKKLTEGTSGIQTAVSHLQEFCQKYQLALPVYEEGLALGTAFTIHCDLTPSWNHKGLF